MLTLRRAVIVTRHLTATVWTLPLLVACAAPQRPSAHRTVVYSEAEEARFVEAARRHPIAIPRERPQYPEQAPPPVAARTAPQAAPPVASAQAPATPPPAAPPPPPTDAPPA